MATAVRAGTAWSELPVVTVRPTVFLEGFFLRFAVAGVRDADELALPMDSGTTSPISAIELARAVSAILDDPVPHIGHVYNLTGLGRPTWTTMPAPSLKCLAGPSAIVTCRFQSGVRSCSRRECLRTSSATSQ